MVLKGETCPKSFKDTAPYAYCISPNPYCTKTNPYSSDPNGWVLALTAVTVTPSQHTLVVCAL